MSERSWNDHAGPVLDARKGFDVIACTLCGFKHVVPIPTVEELAAVYREEYYTVEKPLYLERHREDQEWWNLGYAERYEVFERRLAPDRRRVLEIGSGPGFFLKLGQERGWKVFGVEPSVQAAEHSRQLGVPVANEFLSAENVESFGKFDAIHMQHVLEHIVDPRHMLHLARQLLEPGGILCIVVPNDYNPFQLILRDHLGFEPWWVAPPHHINYFDIESLAHTMAAAGFSVFEKTATFPIDLFLLMGDNYVGNDPIGREAHGRRKRFEHNLAAAGQTQLKQSIYSRLAELGIGRDALVYAERP